jgi:hypothetical protein
VADRIVSLRGWIAAWVVAAAELSGCGVGVIAAEVAGAIATEAASADVIADLDAIAAVQSGGEGHAKAQAAALRLAKLPPDHATQVLDAMNGASPLAKNWLRGVAASVAENGDFPKAQLLAFLSDRSRDGDARHAAFQMLTGRDPQLVPELLAGAESDPSLPLRHMAIARLLGRAQSEIDAGQNDAAIASLRLALAEGRNAEQLKSAAKSLEKLGQSVDLAEELAMLRRWWVAGVYDNTDSKHFHTVYLPEATYLAGGRLPQGWLKEGAKVGDDPSQQSMHLVSSDDALGMVDMNAPLDDAKDAIAYAYVELVAAPQLFEGKDAIVAQARLGCINANQVWVNGQLVTANEVYHSGTRIDQYVGQCELRPGLNTVLIKICQNAQTESWAQSWQFQFRLTDPNGAALQLTTRSP